MDQDNDRRGDEDRPFRVEASTPAARAVVEHARGEADGGERGGHGDEEHRGPAERAGEQSTGEDAGRPTDSRGSAPEAHRPGTVLAWEVDQEQRHRRWA